MPYELEGRTLLRLSDEDLVLNLVLHMGYHYFDGGADTINGFYENNDLVVAGWRAKF